MNLRGGMDEREYFSEVGLLDTIVVTMSVAGMSTDGSRWCLRQDVLRPNGKACARLMSSRSWMDLAPLKRRNLQTPTLPLLALNVGQAPITAADMPPCRECDWIFDRQVVLESILVDEAHLFAEGRAGAVVRPVPAHPHGVDHQRVALPMSDRVPSPGIWRFVSVLIGISPFPSDRITLDPIACVVSLPVGTSCSSVELDQVLKDQVTPAISARLD
jgi:hypothetical protein